MSTQAHRITSLTPLSTTASKEHAAVVKLFLATGQANVNSMDVCGATPFSDAVSEGHEAIVRLLLEIGTVEVDSTKHYDGGTPFSPPPPRISCPY